MYVNLHIEATTAPPPFPTVFRRLFRFWQNLRLSDEARSGAQGLAVEAGDLAAAVEDGRALGGRHDVFDPGEGLAARAVPDLAQDRVRRVASVGQHDVGGRGVAHLLVGDQRV